MKRLLRIAQVCADRGIAPGGTKGASRHLAGVAAGLARLGHTVTTFTSREAVGDHPARCCSLESLDHVESIDVVYERYSLSSGAGLRNARRLGVPFVLEVNSPLVAEARKHRPGTVADGADEAELESIRGADLVVVVSRTLAKMVRSYRTGPTQIIGNGFEEAWFPEPANTGAQLNPTLVFLGHPKPWHGADRIPGILVELANIGHRPSLMLVGGGSGVDSLGVFALPGGVDAKLSVTGSVPPDEASRLVSKATIGIAPYPTHPDFYFCPLKIVDYLAAGLPVVTTDQGDLSELVGDAGVVVRDPDDDKAFAAAIADLLDNPTTRVEMGAAGRRRAFDSMTWDHVAKKTEGAIHLAAARL